MPDLSSSHSENALPLKTIVVSLLTLVAAIVLYFVRGMGDSGAGEGAGWWVELAFVITAAAALSIVIWQACDPFADAAQWVGVKARLPSSVRGATLDAIASSMPELFTGLFFVVVVLMGEKESADRLRESAEGYGSTIATCAGSSIYNMILIPAICAIAVSYSRRTKPYIEVGREVIYRDGLWVIFTQLGLLVFLFQPQLSWWMAAFAILAYVFYVTQLYVDTLRFRGRLDSAEIEADEPNESAGLFFGAIEVGLNGWTASVVLVVSTLTAAVACWVLVELTNDSAHYFGIEPFFVAVILTAAVSSIPDTFVSLGSARRGDDSGAMANVFGSNIFDICIGMSIPLLVCCYLNDWQAIDLIDENDQTLRGVVGLRVFLFGLTAIAMYLLWQFKKVSRRMGWFFCLLYSSFVLYAILGAMEIVEV